MRSQSPSAGSCGMTDPRSQSHRSLMMPILGAVTEHWALNKVRSSGYRVVQMAQTSKALGELVGRGACPEQSEGNAGSPEAIGTTEGVLSMDA